MLTFEMTKCVGHRLTDRSLQLLLILPYVHAYHSESCNLVSPKINKPKEDIQATGFVLPVVTGVMYCLWVSRTEPPLVQL